MTTTQYLAAYFVRWNLRGYAPHWTNRNLSVAMFHRGYAGGYDLGEP